MPSVFRYMKAMTAPKSGRKLAVYQKDVKMTLVNVGLYHHKPKHHQSQPPILSWQMIWWRILAKMWHLMMLRQSQPSKGRI